MERAHPVESRDAVGMNMGVIAQLWDRIRESLWFIPGLLMLGATGLATVTPWLDRLLGDAWLQEIPLIYSAGPTGARAVLSTIATSMITIAGVVFSMTVVSLQLASSQFGPRLLRTFLRDRGNQVVLGTYAGVFLYCILVLPNVDGSDDASFVPRMAVTIAIALAVLGLGMLIYFIHHVAQSIHADGVIRAVSAELEEVLDTLFPERIGDDPDESSASTDDESVTEGKASFPVRSESVGYIRYIDGERLIETAARGDVLVRIEKQPGSFVFADEVVATILTPGPAASDTVIAEVRSVFALGNQRTALQDLAFSFDQLAEMAARALSPGINDPTTALHCIDRIGAGLLGFAARRLPARVRLDADGVPRLIAESVALTDLLRTAVDPIARCAGPHLEVTERLLIILGMTYEQARRPEDQRCLELQGRWIVEDARSRLDIEADRMRVRAAAAWVPSTEDEAI